MMFTLFITVKHCRFGVMFCKYGW